MGDSPTEALAAALCAAMDRSACPNKDTHIEEAASITDDLRERGYTLVRSEDAARLREEGAETERQRLWRAAAHIHEVRLDGGTLEHCRAAECNAMRVLLRMEGGE